MKNALTIIPFLFQLVLVSCSVRKSGELAQFTANDPQIMYVGRVDDSHLGIARYWQPGVYFQLKFKGQKCELMFNDEMLWGKNRNYIQIIVDGIESRIQLKGQKDTIEVSGSGGSGWHNLTVVKNTEANIGYLEFSGLRAEAIAEPESLPARKIEFIGNSITCGMGSDKSEIPCNERDWYDQHNAWLSYGSIAARSLNAQFHLSSVSGIGLMHSCCEMNILMPQVYNKVAMHNDSIVWDFRRYKPDLVTICLGQNDGIQDSIRFQNNYIAFVEQVINYNPEATILLLSSPMADAVLREFLRIQLTAVTSHFKQLFPEKVSMHVFEKSYNNGCGSHPDIFEHRVIAAEIQQVIREKMNW